MTDFKVHQFDFGWGSAQDPAGGAYSAPQTPSWIWGPLSGRGGAGQGKRRERRGEEEVEGGKGRAPKLLLNQGPSEPCYATADVYSSHGRSQDFNLTVAG